MDSWVEMQTKSKEGTTTGSLLLVLVILLVFGMLFFARGQQQRGVYVNPLPASAETG